MERDPLGLDPTFWTFFDASQNPMALIGDDDVYLDLNVAAVAQLRWTRERFVGTHALQTVPEAERAARTAELASVGASPLVVTGLRHWSCEDGTILTVEYCRIPAVSATIELSVYLPVADGSLPAPGAATPREREVIRLLALGCSIGEIGEQLHLSPHTVRTHVRNTMGKLGAQSRAHLIAMAIRDGLVAV